MSSEIIVSRPHYDSRAAAQGVHQKSPSLEQEVPQPSSGSATAGYRSAKYTPAEWFSNYQTILVQAGTNRRDAQNIQQESRTLSQDTEAAALKTQATGTRLLGERLQEIHSWKSELQRHIELLQADTESLLMVKKRLERALDATEHPYAIATDNLTCRARRLRAELVRDTVEEELLKEVDLIRSIQALLKTTAAQVVAQINVSTPSSWTKFTQDNLSTALQEDHATKTLRMLVEQMLQDTTEDLRVQCASVDRAFSLRCEDLIEAKTQLEMKLAQTLEQIGAQEKNIEVLQRAVHNKEAPLRVAQSRLYLRSLRPNMELCRDQPQLSLEGEVRQIDASLESLKQKLSEARSSLSRLEESRMALEKDISCKTNSLFIEREKCMIHRKRYPTVSVLSGY
ncbi:tektin-4 isoform X2 [Poecilia reticulata]|uniref:tektin-4 isoform X2 n=1 Tax=Poecilia reticulata TaxID=8081 RepID=UPI0004A2CB67|nr:PREDICTED: tektin-4 isoform X2 [Poecilia reticulata]